MTIKRTKAAAVALGVVLASNSLLAAEMDRVSVEGSSRAEGSPLSKDAAIHVHLFDASGADLGRAKYVDVARAMANSAPHLLAADIVHALREAGFSAVTLDESEGGAPGGALQLTGRFTKLDPGSQNLRVWIGFGAGKSEVCISGKLVNAEGTKIADFDDCRSGLGWGQSGPQGDKGAEVLGNRVAGLIVDISE